MNGEWESDGHEARRDYEREETTALKAKNNNAMGACVLAEKLKKIVAEQAGVSVCWEQNSEPLTRKQLANIHNRIEELFDRIEFAAWIQEGVNKKERDEASDT